MCGWVAYRLLQTYGMGGDQELAPWRKAPKNPSGEALLHGKSARAQPIQGLIPSMPILNTAAPVHSSVLPSGASAFDPSNFH